MKLGVNIVPLAAIPSLYFLICCY